MRVLSIEVLPDKECKLKEKELHKKYSDISYRPLLDGFSGKTECFEPDIIVLQIGN